MNIGSKVVPVREMRGIVHYSDSREILASRGPKLLRSCDGGKSWHPLLQLPLSLKGGLTGITQITRRLFRQDVYHLAPVDEQIVVVFAFRAIFVCDCYEARVERGPTPICGSRPLVVCRGPNGNLYYGEYRGDRHRTPAHIFGSDDQGRSWRSVYRLDGVRHVHGVYYDPFEDALWVTTGDTDEESGVWVSEDRFRSLRKVLGGNQQSRVIQLLFTPEHVYFGTDAPEVENHIYRLCRHTRYVEQLARVDGPVFHGCRTASGLFFSTACEPSNVNRKREAVVWYSRDGRSWRPILRYRKDLLPMRWFQYGQVFFADGQEDSPGVWLTPFATQESQRSLYFDEQALLGQVDQ
jgi:hypothetical protein